MSYYDDVTIALKGKWLIVLSEFIPALQTAIKKGGTKHIDCPFHGGKKDFRFFKDAFDTGGAVCTCKTWSNGWGLIMDFHGISFSEALDQVGSFLGVENIYNTNSNEKTDEKAYVAPAWIAEAQKKMEVRLAKELEQAKFQKKKNETLWSKCRLFAKSAQKPLFTYLRNRGLSCDGKCFKPSLFGKDNIRYHHSLPYYNEDGIEKGKFPAIVCAIRNCYGDLLTLHRTYLTPYGAKAEEFGDARKMMPIPPGIEVSEKGAAIQLGDPLSCDGIMGVAEGLETAISAAQAHDLPVWSTVNATLMEMFLPPKGVHTVIIYADKDVSRTGEFSAKILKDKLIALGYFVYILMPRVPIPIGEKGVDWNDVYLTQGRLGFPNAADLKEFVIKRRQLLMKLN